MEYTVDNVIRPLVLMNRYKRNISPKFYIVNIYISRLKKQYLSEGAGKATNEYVIFDLIDLIKGRRVVERFDSDKGNFHSWVIEQLNYAILDRFRANDRQSYREYKTWLKYGEKSDISYIEDMDILGKNSSSKVIEEISLIEAISDYIGREVLELQLKGVKQAEIALKLGYKPDYFAVKMCRKRKGLLKHLKKVGFDEDDIPEVVLRKLQGGSNG